MRLPGPLGRHTEFISNVATLMSGKIIAATIALVTTPIVSRLFTPEDFGISALYVSIISMVARVAPLKYEAAIVLPREDQEAYTLMALAYRLVFLVSVGVLAVVAVQEVLGIPVEALVLLGDFKWLLPIGVLLMAAIDIQDSWLTRSKSFRAASASLAVGNAATGGARIGFGTMFGSSVGGLVGGQVVGMVSRLAVQRTASRERLKEIAGHRDWRVLRDTAVQYVDFPKLNAPATLIFTLGQNLPVLLFGVMFAPAIAGYYAMANQLIRRPVDLVANSTRRVFLQKAASVHKAGRSLRKAFLLSTGTLALLGMPALAALWFFGGELATWFLGDRWSVAGQYLEIIAPWLFMLWVMAPCNPVFVILREQQRWLLLQMILTLMRLGAFGVAYVLSAGPAETLSGFVLVTVFGNVVTWVTALFLISSHRSGDA